jgi:hypothetical protein
MPEPTGKTADTPALDLRLWVPAEGDLRNIAGELAAKVAEHLGAAAPDAKSLAAKVAGLTSQLGNGGGPQAPDIVMDFRQVDGELIVEARCAGSASEVRQEIPV